MEFKLLIVSLIVLGIFTQTEANGQCPPITYFYYNFDWVLEDHVVQSYMVPNQDLCYAHCIKEKLHRCRSLNYKIETDTSDTGHQCDINYSTKNRHPESMKQRPGWVYEEIKDAATLPSLDRVVVKTGSPTLLVEEFKDVTISCSASGQPKPTITWRRFNEDISGNGQSKNGELTLLSVRWYDKGTYICEATNVLNTESVQVKITVVKIAHFTITPPEQVQAKEGSLIQLDCQGTRLSNVTWKREGDDLPTDHLLHPNGTLILLNVSDGASGLYMCKINTDFRSVNTTTRVNVTHRSCSHLKAAYPSKISGNYYIDPDGEGGEETFVAYCDMTDKDSVGVTVISHDKETRERVEGCDPAGCFVRDVTYTDVTLTQLANLTRVSSHCEQFIMFECYNDVEFIGVKAAWWISRDREPMYYWGGATPYSRNCACGMTNTCKDGRGCNCKNLGVGWRNDSGMLTDKFSLPVIGLRFGDVNNDHEDGYYTLGKFKCYGIISIIEPVSVYAPTSLVDFLLETVTLSCQASGRPEPLLTWRRKDGQALTGITKAWSFSEGITNLTFLQVYLGDQGTYICEAKNDFNKATAETNLVVIKFTVTPPSLVTAPEGAWIQLDCQTNINSNITWWVGGGDLPKGHLFFANGTLLLLNATALHSGQYICAVKHDSKEALMRAQVLIGNLSCSHIKAGYPGTPSGNYTVDPDSEAGEGPFVVYCDMNDKKGTGVTVIDHDGEDRNHIRGSNASGSYSRNVTYTGASLTQLSNLIRVSTHCEQFAMFECNGSVVFIEEKASWWLSRDRKPMYYWGGASPGSKKCACGMTNTCEGGGVCNCKNYGPGGWRNDSGLLTDRSRLPVTQLKFGSMNEGSFYTLEKFKCFGINTMRAAISWVSLTINDIGTVWVNGKEPEWPTYNNDWKKALYYTFKEPLQVLAVKITNKGGETGLLASFSDGSVTSASSGWKCIVGSPAADWNQVGFDDSSWPPAVENNDPDKVKDINRKAEWIRSNVVSTYQTTFCRRVFIVW